MQVVEETLAKNAPDSNKMQDKAEYATDFLKSLAHTSRLMILCRLSEGPATVGELEEMLDVRQSSVSKQLARLRQEGLVTPQRDGRSIYYNIADERARRIVATVYELFCD